MYIYSFGILILFLIYDFYQAGIFLLIFFKNNRGFIYGSIVVYQYLKRKISLLRQKSFQTLFDIGGMIICQTTNTYYDRSVRVLDIFVFHYFIVFDRILQSEFLSKSDI